MNSTKFNPVAFILNLAITLSVGYLGSWFTLSSVKTWYVTINKPSFNPPDWIFPPVWTGIFILIAIAAYRIWQKKDQIQHFPRTVAVYLIQLILNLLWSFIFFYSRQIGVALFEIVVLLMVVIFNAWVFYKIDKPAGLLFIPYILWLSFATVLTYNIFVLN